MKLSGGCDGVGGVRMPSVVTFAQLPCEESAFVVYLGKSGQGCFIALSGVNGNVTGSYDELKKHNANVELITGDDLLDLIRQVYSLRDLKGVLDLVKAAEKVCWA
jgi:hypothetical protein